MLRLNVHVIPKQRHIDQEQDTNHIERNRAGVPGYIRIDIVSKNEEKHHVVQEDEDGLIENVKHVLGPLLMRHSLCQI